MLIAWLKAHRSFEIYREYNRSNNFTENVLFFEKGTSDHS